MSDVPGRVEVDTRRVFGAAVPTVQIAVRARDKQFELLDNATVNLRVDTPDKRQIELIARATPKRHYYLQSRLGNRLFELGLGPVALAICAASSVGSAEM